MVLGSHLEAVSTRAHQLEICSDLLVCSPTGPVPDGTVENRGRVGRRHDRYAGGNRDFFDAKMAKFGLLSAALLGGFIVNLSTFWLFCFIPTKTRACAANG